MLTPQQQELIRSCSKDEAAYDQLVRLFETRFLTDGTTLTPNEQHLRVVGAHIREMVAFVDADSIIRYASPSFQHGLGYTPDAMIGERMLKFAHAEDAPRLLKLFEYALVYGSDPLLLLELRCLRPNGEVAWVETSVTVVFQPDGQPDGLIVVLRSIDERRELEALRLESARLQVALQKEQELNALKTRMMTRIGHEFRTPLTVIQSCCQLLDLYADRMTEAQRREKFDQVYEQVQHFEAMISMIDRAVRGVSFISGEFLAEPVDFAQLCRDAIDQVRREVGEQAVFKLEASETPLVTGDGAVLRLALAHILMNAVRFSPPHAPVALILDVQEGEARLRVTDTGIGIPPEEEGHVFEPFFRGSNIGEMSGLGLGLTLAQAAVRAHRGRICLSTRVGKGTTVLLRLPLAS
jgi:PAS domain S-box-containing protein